MTDTPTPAPTLEFDLEMLIKQHDKDAYTHAHFRRMGDVDFHAQTAAALRWAAAEIARERARAEKAEALLREVESFVERICVADTDLDQHDDDDDMVCFDVADARAARALAAKIKGEG